MAKKKTAGTDATDATPTTGARRRTTKRGTTASTAGASTQLGGEAPGEAVNRQLHTASDREPAESGSTAAGLGSGNGHASEGSPSYEQIAEAAYQRYLRRGSEHGRDFDDWVEAERELRMRR